MWKCWVPLHWKNLYHLPIRRLRRPTRLREQDQKSRQAERPGWMKPLPKIQKILSETGVASRRKAEELIREGRVTVNGRTAQIGDRADPSGDHIKVDGRRGSLPPSKRY